METVTIHAKVFATDTYGEQSVSGYTSTAAMTLAALVAPNNDPTRVAVGRADAPIRMDVFIPGGDPNGINPEVHVAKVRGVVYEIDGVSEEWQYMSGQHAGDHFTVTQSFTLPADSGSSSSSSSS